MSARTAALGALFGKALGQLRTELQGYPDDQSVWRLAPGIRNSAGTLALHVTGNFQHFIGAGLGGTGYVRDRDAEFSDRDLPREALLRRVDETLAVVGKALGGLDDALLEQPFPAQVPPALAEAATTQTVLTYIYGHFNYHLGQVNYHRRVLTGVGGEG
ncbi:MAG: DUF1572 family protein [Gemmatimonadota bacterium]|nr:DUF1572 family protein [Gemmatimonadota bacterium]